MGRIEIGIVVAEDEEPLSQFVGAQVIGVSDDQEHIGVFIEFLQPDQTTLAVFLTDAVATELTEKLRAYYEE